MDALPTDHLRPHCGSSRRIFVSRRTNSTGLVSNSSAASAFSRAPASACADSAMIGMPEVAGVLLSWREASQPSITGS